MITILDLFYDVINLFCGAVAMDLHDVAEILKCVNQVLLTHSCFFALAVLPKLFVVDDDCNSMRPTLHSIFTSFSCISVSRIWLDSSKAEGNIPMDILGT